LEAPVPACAAPEGAAQAAHQMTGTAPVSTPSPA
jgi:hypothetical protein